MSDLLFPAEWRPNRAVWLAWPSHPEEWLGDLEAPRQAVAELCAAIADVDAAGGRARGEAIELLVLDDAGAADARTRLGATPARLHGIPFGDIWLRDTGPVFVYDREAGGMRASCFAFNGWGGKYLFEHDPEVGERIARAAEVAGGLAVDRHDWVLEGGAVDVDGEGTLLTTRQCLLHPNRNPGLGQAEIEKRLRAALGIDTVLWLGRGLENDHTDGHVDTLARFVAPGRVVCMRAAEPGDPNRDVLEEIFGDLKKFRDGRGRALEVVDIPSPGLVLGAGGEVMPASYVNFYIGNSAVVVPTYGTAHDARAVESIAALFPGRRTVGVDARAVLAGGGAFHCITKQQPAEPGEHVHDSSEVLL